jgi:hypothetical protein
MTAAAREWRTMVVSRGTIIAAAVGPTGGLNAGFAHRAAVIHEPGKLSANAYVRSTS